MLVRDIESAIRAFDFVPGIKQWNIIDIKADAFEMLYSEPFNIKVGKNEMFGIGLEIIQPYDSPDSYMESYLNCHGEGLHHFAFDFDDHKEHLLLVDLMLEEGFTVVYSAINKGNVIHYIESPDGGIVFELKSRMKQ